MPVFQNDYHTESAGTAIVELIPSVSGMTPRLTDFAYKCAGTAHNTRWLRAVAATTAAANAAAGQKVIEFTDTGAMKNPSDGSDEVIAANDYVVYQVDGGGGAIIEEWNTVASISGNDVTLTNNIAKAIDAGGRIWIFGEIARACHVTHLAEINAVNTRVQLTVQGGIPGQLDPYNARTGFGDPCLFVSDNLTAAGALKHLSGGYSSEVAMT